MLSSKKINTFFEYINTLCFLFILFYFTEFYDNIDIPLPELLVLSLMGILSLFTIRFLIYLGDKEKGQINLFICFLIIAQLILLRSINYKTNQPSHSASLNSEIYNNYQELAQMEKKIDDQKKEIEFQTSQLHLLMNLER